MLHMGRVVSFCLRPGILLALCLVVAAPLAAQSYQGGIRGRVSDASGAMVTGSKVTLIDEATHVSRATITNPEGEMVFRSRTF